MTDALNATVVLPDGMPDAGELIKELRAAPEAERAAIIARYPVLQMAAPVPVFAQWLGVEKASIYMARTRTRTSDGLPEWPDTDKTILGRKAWTFAEIALHRASGQSVGWNLRGEARKSTRQRAGQR